MKTNYIMVILLVIICTFLVSCNKPNDNNIVENYIPKLVLHAFISPFDTVLKVHVSSTKNIYGTITPYPRTLPVVVNFVDNNKLIPFSEIDSSGFCSLIYNIEPGKEYQIIAQCVGYPDVSGKCRVPSLNNFDIFIDTFSVTYTSELESYTERRLKVRFCDLSNEVNYYNIWGVETNSYAENDSASFYVGIFDDGKSDLKMSNLISDHLIEGQSITTIFDDYTLNHLSDTALHFLKFEAQVLNTDVNYYLYHTTLLKYKSSENPFTEFSPVFSNISNGYGVFASYIKYKKQMIIKNNL